jgi:hypothetical protein
LASPGGGLPGAGNRGSGYQSSGCRGGFCKDELFKKSNAQLNPNAPPDKFQSSVQNAGKPDCLRTPAKAGDGAMALGGLLAAPALINRALNGDCPK